MNEFAKALEGVQPTLRTGKKADKKTISRTIPFTCYTWGRMNVATMKVDLVALDVVPMGYTDKEKEGRARALDAVLVHVTETERVYTMPTTAFVEHGKIAENVSRETTKGEE